MAEEMEKDKQWNEIIPIKILARGCNNYPMGATAAESHRWAKEKKWLRQKTPCSTEVHDTMPVLYRGYDL